MNRWGKAAAGFAAVLCVAGCVFLGLFLAGQGLERASLWAAVLGLPAGALAAAAGVWALVVQRSRVLVPPELEAPEWVVDRPEKVEQVVAALLRGRGGTVGITTGLYGAGGFGKTTLALMVSADRRVRQRFDGGVYLVTVGRDLRGAAAVAAKVNDVIKLVAGEEATFTDPELAGRRLGALLDGGRRRLLVVDDVWEPEQLAPFAAGGRRCGRLVTTRVPGLLAGRDAAVRVDQMSADQAQQLLTAGLPPLDAVVGEGLLAVTGQWPLLLRLVNKILVNAASTGDVSAAGEKLLKRLREDGPAAVDELTGEASRSLQVGHPADRALAVRATIGASTSLLSPQDAQRFTELGVFAEDEAIPFTLVAQLWRACAGLDDLRASQLCARLSQLALVSPTTAGSGGVVLHDVVRDFLRGELGPGRPAALNGVLLDAVASGLSAVGALNAAAAGSARVPWWDLGFGDRYLWDHLIEHLLDAGRRREAEEIAGDLRWVGARVQGFGPAAPAADLSLVDTPRATRLRAALARTAHLLAPTDPAAAVVDVLHSRVAADPDWGAQVSALRDLYPRPRLVNSWPLPDLPDSSLRRVLTGHIGALAAVAIAPDGSWLASSSYDGTARIWDAATGQPQAILAEHKDEVMAVAIAPDGSWLATGSSDGTARIWDAATGQPQATLTGHKSPVGAVAIAPDGSWLATGGFDGTARIWDAVTGQRRATLTGHVGLVAAVAIAPDGSWLVTSGFDGTARIWDTSGQPRATLAGHESPVGAVAIAPDGSWLATGSSGGTARIWEAATGQLRATLTNQVAAVAIAPDGSWLATGGVDGTARIWDAATGQLRAILAGHAGRVAAVAIAPDGSWLATGSYDGTARIWDAATGQPQATLTNQVAAVAIAPDGSWLATGSYDGTARIWDAATGQPRATLNGHQSQVGAVAIAPDGSWLATGGVDGTARIWDAATGQSRATLNGHTGRVAAVAIAPDGSWLATGSSDRSARIWDVVTGQPRASLTGHPGRVAAVAIAPDGSWLATGGYYRAARIWDAATGQLRATLTGHTGLVTAIAIAPDGSWLATASHDRTARIWDAATGQLRATLSGHQSQVTAVAIAPDGSWLATSGDYEGTARIWDAATGQLRATLTGHQSQVTAVAIAPDGSWLATGGVDGTARIWDAVTGRPRALMRIDHPIVACAWHGTGKLAIGGQGGLYLFDFLTDTPQPSTRQRLFEGGVPGGLGLQRFRART